MSDWPREGLELSRGADTVRGTQSFVRVMQWCWQHPDIIALEVLWRWIFGGFALAMLWAQGSRVLAAATGGTGDLSRLRLDQLTVTDPAAAAARLTVVLGLILPSALDVARWLAPLLLVVWLVVSALGRTAVLRRADRELHARPLTLGVLQLVRALALAACFVLWAVIVRAVAAATITGPLARNEPPQLLAYFSVVIVGTLTLFTAWSLLNWSLTLAPLLAMRTGAGPVASLRAALVRRSVQGPVRLKLVEINLVMGIVKIALLVLAMVFSACPLPFETVITPGFLFWWTAGVGVLYVLASDFFHVARQIAYLELWRAYDGSGPAGVTNVR